MNRRGWHPGLALLAAVAGLVLAAPAGAVPARIVRVASMEDLKAALRKAGPATIIELAPGTYAGGLHHRGLRGAAGAPVLIRSAERDRPAVFTHQVQLSGPVHVVLENFVVRGSGANGLNIDDGGSYETPAHHVVLRDLRIEDTGPEGNLDGIKLSGVDDFLLEDCTIERWGSGGSGIDMVGCHRGLILGCTLIDEDFRASSGIQAKGGSSEIVVRGSRFNHAGRRAVNIGGSTGEAYFRPRGLKYESRRVLVLGNTFVGSEAPIAFTTTVESGVLYNRIERPAKWVLRILQEKPVPPYASCGDNTFAHNWVLYGSRRVRTPVNVGPNTRGESFRFAGNLWTAVEPGPAAGPTLPAPETGGRFGKATPEEAARFGAGAAAPGEAQAWQRLGRPMVEWAAGRTRASRRRAERLSRAVVAENHRAELMQGGS